MKFFNDYIIPIQGICTYNKHSSLSTVKTGRVMFIHYHCQMYLVELAIVHVVLCTGLQGIGYTSRDGRRNRGGSGINKPNTVASY